MSTVFAQDHFYNDYLRLQKTTSSIENTTMTLEIWHADKLWLSLDACVCLFTGVVISVSWVPAVSHALKPIVLRLRCISYFGLQPINRWMPAATETVQ